MAETPSISHGGDFFLPLPASCLRTELSRYAARLIKLERFPCFKLTVFGPPFVPGSPSRIEGFFNFPAIELHHQAPSSGASHLLLKVRRALSTSFPQKSPSKGSWISVYGPPLGDFCRHWYLSFCFTPPDFVPPPQNFPRDLFSYFGIARFGKEFF